MAKKYDFGDKWSSVALNGLNACLPAGAGRAGTCGDAGGRRFKVHSILQPCYEIFSELACHVVFHAEGSGGYVIAQQYNHRAGSVVDIAVADSG
jgi:hypothetical protein